MQTAVAAISAAGSSLLQQSRAAGSAGSTSSPSGAPFSDLLSDAAKSVQKLETQARTAVDSLMTGTGADVHEAMIATQKADMAFELALAVRSKAVQAYQAVMGMQF
jgi:flagellar hook-basal body complex protein FliE